VRHGGTWGNPLAYSIDRNLAIRGSSELGGTSYKRASPVRGGGGVRICCSQGLTMANKFIRTWALIGPS
jgi:hypothetical protein